MTNIFLDSSFLVALLDPEDVWHPRANQIDKALSQATNRIFLDIVISESLSVIARRLLSIFAYLFPVTNYIP